MPDHLEKINHRTKRVIEILTERKIVPTIRIFDITERMLEEAVRIYGEMFGTGNGRFNYGYARRLWGLNLLRLKFSRGAKPSECRGGMVYLIANPAWPKYLKIGMSVDTEKRLASYQTYDPLKRYYIKHYEFVLDRREAEKRLLDEFQINLVDGEWVEYANGLTIINVCRNGGPIAQRKEQTVSTRKVAGLNPAGASKIVAVPPPFPKRAKRNWNNAGSSPASDSIFRSRTGLASEARFRKRIDVRSTRTGSASSGEINMHQIEPYCKGEICGMCKRENDWFDEIPATHKVGEESKPDNEMRHNWTQYVCCHHFQKIFNLGTDCCPDRGFTRKEVTPRSPKG